MLFEQESIELVYLTFPFASLTAFNRLEKRKMWRQEAAMWRQQNQICCRQKYTDYETVIILAATAARKIDNCITFLS